MCFTKSFTKGPWGTLTSFIQYRVEKSHPICLAWLFLVKRLLMYLFKADAKHLECPENKQIRKQF